MSAASEATKDAVILVLLTPFVLFAAAAMSALPLMLGLGIVHADITALGALVAKFRPYVVKRGAK